MVDFPNHVQIWNLLVLTFSKHPLHVQFDQVLAEIFEVKDTWYHSFIFMIVDFLDMKRRRRVKIVKHVQFFPLFHLLEMVCCNFRIFTFGNFFHMRTMLTNFLEIHHVLGGYFDETISKNIFWYNICDTICLVYLIVCVHNKQELYWTTIVQL